MRPFQPATVRGFSKYARITTTRSSASRRATSCSRSAYSIAASGSWIEHGPTTAISRESSPRIIAATSSRALATVAALRRVSGSSSRRIAGGMSGRISRMRRSSVRRIMGGTRSFHYPTVWRRGGAPDGAGAAPWAISIPCSLLNTPARRRVVRWCPEACVRPRLLAPAPCLCSRKEVPMFGRILASVFFAGLVCTTAAVAQAPPPLLAWSPVPRPVFLSLDAVQAQVDATLTPRGRLKGHDRRGDRAGTSPAADVDASLAPMMQAVFPRARRPAAPGQGRPMRAARSSCPRSSRRRGR